MSVYICVVIRSRGNHYRSWMVIIASEKRQLLMKSDAECSGDTLVDICPVACNPHFHWYIHIGDVKCVVQKQDLPCWIVFVTC